LNIASIVTHITIEATIPLIQLLTNQVYQDISLTHTMNVGHHPIVGQAALSILERA
jgi:hydroxyethylthiazole kinase-like sugar kinase family protein